LKKVLIAKKTQFTSPQNNDQQLIIS